MKKLSIRADVRAAKQAEARATKDAVRKPTGSAATLGAPTLDSFVNFAHKLGVGADNALTSGTYGYNPITRNRQLLEWIHRGSWLGGVAIDIVADDMTRAGVDFLSELEPGDSEKLEAAAGTLGMWDGFNDAIKWGRLYGGSIAVLLVDGQDPKTPLRLETVGKDQFKGILSLDRWQVEPSLEDLVTDYGAHLGLPKFYKVQANAPAMRGGIIHHTRIAARFDGIRLPYNQRLTENLWGISVLERLYDRMIAFDSASTGAAQLVFKAHLRTLKIPGLREIVAAGNQPMNGLLAYTEVMRRFQGIEGISLIDGDDEFDVQGAGSAFAGVQGIVEQLADQLAGALQIPKTRLFGQSPGGFSGGKDDAGERTYYDGIRQKQRKELGQGVNTAYKLLAQSNGIMLPDEFAVDFSSLYELDDTQKAEVAAKVTTTVQGAKDAGLVSQKTALLELRQSSRITNVWTNITQADIDGADDEVQEPVGEDQLLQMQLDAKAAEGAGGPAGGAAKGKPGKAVMSLPGDAGDSKGKPPPKKRVALAS